MLKGMAVTPPSHQPLLRSPYQCKSVGALPEPVMNAGAKKSNATEDNHVRIVLYTAMASRPESSMLMSVLMGANAVDHVLMAVSDCTYDQPSNRRRNPAPQYIEALENRLQRAEALLKTVLPDVDLNDANFDAGVPQRMHAPGNSSEQQPSSAQPRSSAPPGRSAQGVDTEKDPMLESMVQRTGSLDLDDRGHWDFHGHSSGLVFLRRMREQFGDLMGGTEGTGLPFQKNTRPMPPGLDSPKSSAGSPNECNLPSTHDLPPKDCGRELCENALDDACALMRFIHQPTFYQLFDRIYDTPPERFTNEENKFLPLLYLVMALGCLFAKGERSRLEIKGYEGAIDQG